MSNSRNTELGERVPGIGLLDQSQAVRAYQNTRDKAANDQAKL